MAEPRPFTAEDRARLRELHAGGMARNDIAREMGRSGSTISKYAEDEGLAFDREVAQAATKARQADNRAKRSELESRYLTEALALMEEMRQAHVAFNFGGKDNTYVEHHFDEPPAETKLTLMKASGTAIDRALKLSLHDADTGVEQARSMLADLFDALGKRFRGDDEQPE